MVVIYIRWLYASSPASFSKQQIILLLFFKFLIPSKEIARFHKKKEREEIPSKKKRTKKRICFFLCCANRETWQFFFTPVKQGKLVNLSSRRGSPVIVFRGIMGICIVLAKKNNASRGCINCLHERHLLQPKKLSIFKSMHGWNSVRLLIYTRILLFQSPESCPFVTEKQKCCRLPFLYKNRTYTACTADVPDKDWKEQWSSPWCFPETPEKDRSTKYRCLRNSKLRATFKCFTAKL